MVWPTAGVGWVASAEDWLDSPYLDRLVTRVASLHLVPAAELPDLIQETRIALWQAGLEAPVSSALVACIARRKSIDLVRELARRRARRRAARILATNQEVDADLHHLLSLKVAALPQRLHEFYELHYEQGLSEREIARSWGLCRASVRWLDRRCRDLLLGIREHLPRKTRISKSD